MSERDGRPDPDALLQKIEKEHRGRLTIFLGAAAGVGKTYAMLEAARERQTEGVDVVIGWIETHGREETKRLAEGLSGVEPLFIDYRGKQLAEMDLDAILQRKPEIALVDELAHANIAGSRHIRRFQDVEDLLAVGIDVYSTLNIQHIESLNDVVAQITGVIVRETVPDRILENADVVRLIDISPEELIKRLQDGKVYIPAQAAQALQKFFRAGNINALRELSLRYTARRVDKALQNYMVENRIDGPWPASGRIMVCVGDNPSSAQLIRAAHRLANGMQSELLAVHIEPSVRSSQVSDAANEKTINNLRLAEDLGAVIITAIADDVCAEIVEIARKHNVAAIVVGRPRHTRLRAEVLIFGCGGFVVMFNSGAGQTSGDHAGELLLDATKVFILHICQFGEFCLVLRFQSRSGFPPITRTHVLAILILALVGHFLLQRLCLPHLRRLQVIFLIEDGIVGVVVPRNRRHRPAGRIEFAQAQGHFLTGRFGDRQIGGLAG